jgi:glycerol-3-phosphate responsive antiterminator
MIGSVLPVLSIRDLILSHPEAIKADCMQRFFMIKLGTAHIPAAELKATSLKPDKLKAGPGILPLFIQLWIIRRLC